MAVPFDQHAILELESLGISGPQRCGGEAERELETLQKEGKPLPEDYYDTANGFYYMPSDPDTLDRVRLALELKQLRYLRTIKRGVLFLVLLALLGLIIPLFFL